MKYLKTYSYLLLFFSFLANLRAQDSGSTSALPEVGSYSIIVLNSEIGENFYFFTQGRIHHYDLFDNQKQFLIRAAIEYKFSKMFKIHIGAANVDQQPFDKLMMSDFVIQRWVYDEFQFTFGSADKIQLKTRFRHERRWITPNNQLETIQDDRLRLRMTLIRNLGENFYAKLFSEAFYSVKNKDISKFRNNFTFGAKISKELKLEAGIIDEGKLQNKHTFVVTRLYITTSWRNKENHSKTKSSIDSNNIPETPKEIIFNNNNDKLNNILDEHPADFILPQEKEEETQLTALIPEIIEEKDQDVEKVELEEVTVEAQELRHFVIVAAHMDRESTSKTLDRLQRDGYLSGKVLEVNENGYYRVSGEDYTSKEKAELTRLKLAEIGYVKPWILSTTVTVTTTELRPVVQEDIDKEDQPIVEKSNDIPTVDEEPEIVDQVFDENSNLMVSDIINIQNQDTELLQKISAQRQDQGIRKFKSPIYHLVVGAVTELGYAPKHLEELKSKGYKRAYVFKKPFGGLYRISAAKSRKIEDLHKLIPNLNKDGYQFVWIFDTTIIDYEELNKAEDSETVEQINTVTEKVDHETIETNQESATIDIAEIESDPIVYDTESNTFEYDIIISSSKDLKIAQNTVSKLKAKGYYNASVLPQTFNEFYRVSAAHFSSEQKAREALTDMKANAYSSAWLFKSIPQEEVAPEIDTEDQSASELDSMYERSTASIPYRPIYHVIAASTKELKTAQSILKSLHQKGFVNAYILEEKSNGFYRISAAHFKDQNDTLAAIELLAKQGNKDAWVHLVK